MYIYNIVGITYTEFTPKPKTIKLKGFNPHISYAYK